ncbi:acetyl/propionyl/methylcrotonyl-CoA carboxylase subunit alpha [Zavarzinia sp. CC-PAN008]|uniref:acetyl/propionyl/methylcrotonyl-CoA carboxylase subunit alpha n=1 Tax=Zavarzinia sp. CC-PAN008 TaxID=3243332 RepID=UPI003F74826C
MIDTILIANRGEIARRIIRTARRLGIRTVAVFSDADATAPHVQEADAAVAIGPAPARESYLVQDRLIEAAKATGADAIHPGYGFLSENAGFAQAVTDAGLTWIGAPPHAILAMGLKDAAKARMAAAGVPTTPGYLGDDQSDARLSREADAIGYPVLIKAVAGGGGKGMRKVDRAEDFAASLASCRREAAGAFGDDRVLLETYVQKPRHIEVQVFGDAHGNVVHLFERDCSLQRRHQKVIEEAPAPGMDEATRDAVTAAAVRAAQAVSYVGAGTIEFIADASEGLRADRIWFMEMNTRLQVEHPVTEAITGLDLVEWQIRVASGEPLPLAQDQITRSGHAIEARLYAENPARGFLPSTGRLERYRVPSAGLRLDSAVEEGGEITPHYDPMIAKLIVHAPTRRGAARQLAQAARGVEVWPVRTNAAFLARALDHPEFLAARVDTGFIDRHREALAPKPVASLAVLQAAAQAILADSATRAAGPWAALPGFRVNSAPTPVIRVAADDGAHAVSVQPAASALTVLRQGSRLVVFEEGDAFALSAARADDGGEGGDAADGLILSPMPGRILSVAVALRDRVKKGQPLAVLEAMKMEHALLAPFDGHVEALDAVAGQQVTEGAALLRVVPA